MQASESAEKRLTLHSDADTTLVIAVFVATVLSVSIPCATARTLYKLDICYLTLLGKKLQYMMSEKSDVFGEYDIFVQR